MTSYKISNRCNCGSPTCLSCQEIASEHSITIESFVVSSQAGFIPAPNSPEGLQVEISEMIDAGYFAESCTGVAA